MSSSKERVGRWRRELFKKEPWNTLTFKVMLRTNQQQIPRKANNKGRKAGGCKETQKTVFHEKQYMLNSVKSC